MPHALHVHRWEKSIRHVMKDCRTFIKLQEAVGFKQAKARGQGYGGTPGSGANNMPLANQTTHKWSYARTRTTKPG
jgi:hypothetical protein